MFIYISFTKRGKRLYLLIAFLIGFILIEFSDISAQNGWTKKENMLIPRAGGSASVVNNKIYVIGGAATSFVYDSETNQVYDLSTDTWAQKKDMPTARGFLFTAAVNDTIYAIGGGDPTFKLKVEAYDPATNTWTPKKDMSEGHRGCNSCCVIDGIIYTVGGNGSEGECWAYNPSIDTFIQKKSLPEGGGYLSVTAYNGLIYAFGGSTYEPWAAIKTVYAYNPQTDTWAQKKNMPTARFFFKTYLVNGKIYAVGGTQSENTSVSTVEVYDPENDTWETKSNMPTSNAFFEGAVVNDKIYVIGGSPDWVSGPGEVWEYNPSVDPTGVEQQLTSPDEFVLNQNYPNPFNPTTNFGFRIADFGFVSFKIYDVLGNEVAILVDEEKPAGTYEVTWTAANLPSGVYFYQLSSGSFTATKKLLLLK